MKNVVLIFLLVSLQMGRMLLEGEVIRFEIPRKLNFMHLVIKHTHKQYEKCNQ